MTSTAHIGSIQKKKKIKEMLVKNCASYQMFENPGTLNNEEL